MQIKTGKLKTNEERLEAERLIATSFLHDWNEEEALKNAENPSGEVWGAFNDQDLMISAVTTLRHDLIYEGTKISCGELHMVGTLPEARGSGAVRTLMGEILRDYRNRGDLFAILIPFSFSFYRKYGFECASEMLTQKTNIQQFAEFEQEFSANRILSQKDVDEAEKLYNRFIRPYNLAAFKDKDAWSYSGNGEFGKRDWMYADKTHYSYLFRDEKGIPRAYFTFVFVHGPSGPFTGTMAVTELVFDSPEALRSVLGFIYGMRAKITEVSVALPSDVDLSAILPECDKVERSLDGHYTARVLNIEKVLSALRHPYGSGQYSIRIKDRFLPENTGTYTVFFSDGRANKIIKSDEQADLEVSVETFCQMAVGLIDLPLSLYKTDTLLSSNESLLAQVFRKKPLFLR